MPEVTWLLFVVASLLLIITPGQDMILVMSRSIAQGAAAGLVTAAGVSVGLVGHTVLATLGLVFAGLTFVVKGPVGPVAGLLSVWLRSRPKVLIWIHRTSGAVLVGLGLRLALERRA